MEIETEDKTAGRHQSDGTALNATKREGTPQGIPHQARIVFLVADFRYGGAQAQVCRVASALAGRGWNVEVVTMLDFPIERPLPDVALHRVGMSRRLVCLRSTVRLLTTLWRLRASCLVTFTYPANLAGRLLGTLLRIPTIVTSMRNERLGGRLKERILRWTDSLGTITTTNSRCVRSSLVNAGIVTNNPIRVIRNAIDLGSYRPCPEDYMVKRSKLGICERDFLWLAIGRLEEQKGYPYLLQAMRLLIDQTNPPIKLMVAGTNVTAVTKPLPVLDLRFPEFLS